jgi:RNA polymerase sporulation-specific sigma factor
LDVLKDTEKEIIIRRYGLFNRKEATQKEIAKDMGISRSYVSRIEKRALYKLLREFNKIK